jgi:hypothetical protein
MPRLDEELTEGFKGKELDVERLRRDRAWFEQEVDGRHHYGLPRRRGLWVFRVETEEPCCHPVMLFVLVQLGSAGRIQKVETMACVTFPNGAYEELDTGLSPPDWWNAEAELSSALAAIPPAGSEEAAHREGGEPEDGRLASLLDFVKSDGRICPMPDAWNALYQALPEGGRKEERPGLPLILGAWHTTTGLDKALRLREQILYAAAHGALDRVDRLLRSLDRDEWLGGRP